MKTILILTLIIPTVLIAQPNHSTWNNLLKEHVSPYGNVDYKGFKNDEKILDAYLDQLKSEYPTKTWTRNDKMAYWINCYNAFTVKAILNHYPIKSITEIKPDNAKSIWKLKWITIEGNLLSLDQIENEILRPNFNDARIHFAINCASVSCPPLRNEAFVAGKLNDQLNQQTRMFFADTKRNKITSNNAQLSQIFDWFSTDFKTNGSLVSFVNKYSKIKINPNTKITYLDYDWSLNN
ncbi:MAG: DUF547 domain-containing protein [Bacteroidia bacterium]